MLLSANLHFREPLLGRFSLHRIEQTEVVGPGRQIQRRSGARLAKHRRSATRLGGAPSAAIRGDGNTVLHQGQPEPGHGLAQLDRLVTHALQAIFGEPRGLQTVNIAIGDFDVVNARLYRHRIPRSA